MTKRPTTSPRRRRTMFVSAAEARTVAEAKRIIRHKIPWATDVIARRANPMKPADGFIAEFTD